MCDYSLGGMRRRLAVEGEALTMHRFPTYSIGLASPSDLQPQIANEQAGKQNLWQQIKDFFAASDLPNVAAVCVTSRSTPHSQEYSRWSPAQVECQERRDCFISADRHGGKYLS